MIRNINNNNKNLGNTFYLIPNSEKKFSTITYRQKPRKCTLHLFFSPQTANHNELNFYSSYLNMHSLKWSPLYGKMEKYQLHYQYIYKHQYTIHTAWNLLMNWCFPFVLHQGIYCYVFYAGYTAPTKKSPPLSALQLFEGPNLPLSNEIPAFKSDK